ncbi:cutinase family protein [Bifidobacterium aquikefiri]|uniref:cutinase family protein n=2 Tax=Bifidobacterium aquikefiri TaxID=1653207 RepID=UPI0023F425A5|nr:cutinase family protein [Bifidobacterium aquikefiri]
MKQTREKSNALRWLLRLSVGVIVALSCLSNLGIRDASAVASAPDQACRLVDVVFARGSGEEIGKSPTSNTFNEKFSEGFKALTGTNDFNFYELGSQSIKGHQYPAIPVGADHPINTAGAFISAGESNAYGESVDKGVDELTAYIKSRIDKCGSSQLIVLAGYSQGAQVIGETYFSALTTTERSHVVFNSLFGDPKLYLPEGESGWHKQSSGDWFNSYYALACSGDMNGSKESYYSQWRREVPDCNTDNGSLGARKPYLPSGFTGSTELWCSDDDFVCGSSKWVGTTSGHMTYHNSAVGEGVRESLERLATRLPSTTDVDVDAMKKIFLPLRAGSTGLDVVFLIDSTGSMSGSIEDAKAFAATFSATIQSLNGRVALVEYRDAGDEFTARMLSGLDEDVTDFQNKLAGIEADGGGDEPEAALHALSTAFTDLEWRNGATKAAVVLTDAGFHDPDDVDGSTVESVAQQSLSIDPVNVYPVVPSWAMDDYKVLAEKTSGQVIENAGDAEVALNEALTKIATRPVVLLPLNAYYIPVDGTAHFDASGSYSVDSAITRWDWDFDGDGEFEIENGTAQESHQYTVQGDFNMQLRVTDAAGGISSHSVPVHVGTINGREGEPKPATSVNVLGDGTNATLSWTADEELIGGQWWVTVNGIVVGSVSADARQVGISDLDRSSDIEIGVRPVSAEGVAGKGNVTYLDAERPATIVISASKVNPGDKLTVSGENFPKDSEGSVTLHSKPVVLDAIATDVSGAFEKVVTIPKDTDQGDHQIIVKVNDLEVSTPLKVEQKSQSDQPQPKQSQSPDPSLQPKKHSWESKQPLARTGASIAASVAACLMLAALATAVIAASRKRRRM